MDSSLAVVLIGIVSLAIGVGLGFWFARSGNELQAEKAAAAESALADYQAKVSTHFEQTAEQFEQIGQQYRKLYGHFANSAQELLGDDANMQQVFPPLLGAAGAVAASEDLVATDEPSDDSVAAAAEEADATESADETTALTANEDAADESVIDEAVTNETDVAASEAVAESSSDEVDVEATADTAAGSDNETVAITGDTDGTDETDTSVRVADEAANEEAVAADDETSADDDTAEVATLDDQPPRLNGAARTADTAHG